MKKESVSIVVIVTVTACIIGVVTVSGVGLAWHSKMREQRRRQKAAENLKAIGEALLQYSGDYGELAPPSDADPDAVYKVPTEAKLPVPEKSGN